MPLAQLYIAAGRDDAKKKVLIEKVTQAFVDANGWYADFPNVVGFPLVSTGERSNIDSRIVSTI